MAICDICNAEGRNILVPFREFRRTVLELGFNPFRLGLVPGRDWANAEADYAFWCRLVRENETDWGLCGACLAAYRETAAAPATGDKAVVGLPDKLEALRRQHPLPAPPGVPADWKPGFFGRGKPWGDGAQAVALIRHGRIAEGRELLKRLLKHGTDLETKLRYCVEASRPPADPELKVGPLVPTLPAPERHALECVIAYAQGDYTWLSEAFLAAKERAPDSAPGAFLLLAGFVGASDLWIQTQILHPRKRSIQNMFVNAPFKALALLLERRHDEAWDNFHSGLLEPETIIAGYRRNLSVDLSRDEEEHLLDAARVYCATGLGLVLCDLGYEAEQRAHFRRLAPQLADGLADAARRLA